MYSYGPVSLFPEQNKSFLLWRGHADGSEGGWGEKGAGGRAEQVPLATTKPGHPETLFSSSVWANAPAAL